MLLHNRKESFESTSYDKLKQIAAEEKKSEKYVRAPIDKLGPCGRWFRHKLLDGILVGTPVLLTIQRHRTPAVTALMRILSFLGTESFFTVLLLYLLWMVDCRLGRLFGILMAVGFYTSGFLKTLLCLPRPPKPPIAPLETAYDWALPSHHSLLGVICPWYIWLYMTLHYELSTFAMSVICCLIVLWSFGVLLSRLYLGVHSPADIVCGGIVGVIVLSMWMQVDDFVDFYVSQQRLEPQLKLIACLFVLLCIHPPAEQGNPSFCDTCVVMGGVMCGIVLGRSQRVRMLGNLSLLEAYPDISLVAFACSLLARLTLGGVVISLLRIALKTALSVVVVQLHRLAGVPYYSSSAYRKMMPLTSKHYTPEYILPPIHQKQGESGENGVELHEAEADDGGDVSDSASETSTTSARKISTDSSAQSSLVVQLWKCFASSPWDVDVPVKTVAYCVITYVAVDVLPQLFSALAI